MLVKILTPGDERALEAFLAPHADSSMILRSNVRSAGLVDRGEPYQATYAAAFEGDRIVAVAAHCWNGNLLLQAPAHLERVVRTATAESGRGILGLLGPWEQVEIARRALGLASAPAAKSASETLFALPLDELVVPEILRSGRVTCRRTTESDLARAAEWRVAFSVEALGLSDGPALRTEAHDGVRRAHEQGVSWVLLDSSTRELLSYSAFNSHLPDVVQIGGVWTPPALRSRGYARAVVAGSLLEAARAGVRRAVLFAEDPAAQRAYVALGFRIVGSYGLVLFHEVQPSAL